MSAEPLQPAVSRVRIASYLTVFQVADLQVDPKTITRWSR
jgi:hypothetical protein